MLPAFVLAIVAQTADPKPIESLPPLVENAMWQHLFYPQALSPDHQRFAVATVNDGVWILSFPAALPVAKSRSDFAPAQWVAWSSDSKTIGLLHQDGRISLVDAATGIATNLVQPSAAKIAPRGDREIIFAAGGKILIAVRGDEPTRIYSTERRELIATLGEPPFSTTGFALDPDREVIALGDDSGLVRLWTTRSGRPLEARIKVPLGQGHRAVHALAFDPTGNMIAIGSGDSTVRLWKIGAMGWEQQLSHSDQDMDGELAIGCLAFSKDGQRLLSVSWNFWEARVWDLTTLRVVDHFDYSGGSPWPLTAWFAGSERYVVGAQWCRVGEIGNWNARSSSEFPGARPGNPRIWWRHDGDYAWAVVDHHLVVRKIPDEEPVFKIPVREG